MPILESKTDQSAARRILLTTGLGVIFGLFFGVPPAFAGHAMGVNWMPFGVGMVLIGLEVGVLLAFLVVNFVLDVPVLRIPAVTARRSPATPPPHPAAQEPSRKYAANTARPRLAKEKAVLDRLDAEREGGGDASLGKAVEQRIIWGELLDLELQDIDEKVSRICSKAPGPDIDPRKGGPNERNSE